MNLPVPSSSSESEFEKLDMLDLKKKEQKMPEKYFDLNDQQKGNSEPIKYEANHSELEAT